MIEYRQAAETSTDGDTLYGLVTPFNTETTIGDVKRGGFYEKVNPGAFTKTLQERDIVLIDAHDTAKPLARTSLPWGVGALELTPDPTAGLRAKAKPVQTSYGKDVLLCADAGVTKGMSFGFEAVKDAWTDDEGRTSDPVRGTHRELLEVRLHEVTTTAFPAYTTSQLSARDAVTAARGAENRAAKASYSDLYTCGSCDATSQYGSFCGGCGGPMGADSDSGNDFCTSCGSPVDDSSRSSHVCATRDAKPDTNTNDGAGSATPDEEAERSADKLRITAALLGL